MSRETSEVKYVVRLKDETRANVPWKLRSSKAGEPNYLSECCGSTCAFRVTSAVEFRVSLDQCMDDCPERDTIA